MTHWSEVKFPPSKIVKDQLKFKQYLLSIYIYLYKLATQSYFIAIKFMSLFQVKARLWTNGRKGIFDLLKKDFKSQTAPIIWMHCASLGEFEQGRPFIELIKSEFPQWKVLLTFFSPSGYEIRKNYELADYTYYLPEDSKKNAKNFLEITKPSIAIFVKYEFWYFILKSLKSKEIPIFLISSIFRNNQLFFKKGFNYLHLEMLGCFDHIFVQNESSQRLLNGIQIANVSVTGDTRIDRVLTISKNKTTYPIIESFCGNHKILICGSTWSKDESILTGFINNYKGNDWRWIIAPHDIQKAHIQEFESKLEIAFWKYSELEGQTDFEDRNVLIIDNIGMLSSLYQYGDLAYIGGGFGAGIHNILEPGAFGLPIIFGTKFQKFEEANFLIRNGGAFSVSNEKALQEVFEKLKNKESYLQSSRVVQNYLKSNEGATRKILTKLRPNFEKVNNESFKKYI